MTKSKHDVTSVLTELGSSNQRSSQAKKHSVHARMYGSQLEASWVNVRPLYGDRLGPSRSGWHPILHERAQFGLSGRCPGISDSKSYPDRDP